MWVVCYRLGDDEEGVKEEEKGSGDQMEGEQSGSTLGLDEECSSGSTSSGDRRKGEDRSKKRQDGAHRQRAR